MRKTRISDIPAYQFHQFQKFSDLVNHAVFTREGGFSSGPFESLNVRFGIGDKHENVIQNRFLISNVMGLESQNIISANQTHSKKVQVIDKKFLKSKKTDAEIEDVDALITNLHDIGLMIQVADCQAILMFDVSKQIVAAVHAGWKGLMQDISGETINVLQDRFGVDPNNLIVGISPSLGPCCSFFTNPAEELPKHFHKYIDAEKRVDLWSFSVDQLKSHGIKTNSIEIARICTQCENGRMKPDNPNGKGQFFSYRREGGLTGRFGALIGIRNY
jgi:polyphenol oxidase